MLKIKQLITGWVNYFGIADKIKLVQSLDEWLEEGKDVLLEVMEENHNQTG